MCTTIAVQLTKQYSTAILTKRNPIYWTLGHRISTVCALTISNQKYASRQEAPNIPTKRETPAFNFIIWQRYNPQHQPPSNVRSYKQKKTKARQWGLKSWYTPKSSFSHRYSVKLWSNREKITNKDRLAIEQKEKDVPGLTEWIAWFLEVNISVDHIVFITQSVNYCLKPNNVLVDILAEQ